VKKLIAINLAVIAALILVFIGAVEAYLRLTVPRSSTESIYTYTTANPRYKLMRANASVTAWGEELRTNELGFRDRPVGPKAPGEFRVVVLGDSFTVSAGVDFRDLYTSRLEKLTGARVINLAVGGYNIVQYALVLREVGLALEPDLVLVALFPDNDFSNETYEENYRVASGKASADPVLAWYEDLYAYRAYGGRLEKKLKSMFTSKPPAAGPDGWNENVAALKAIMAMSAQREVELQAVLLPHTWNFEAERVRFQQVKHECAKLHLQCLDLLARFASRGVRPATLRLNPLDAHPNERYHAIVAEELASPIQQRVEQARAARDGSRHGSRDPSP
jgi:hypothetical protein